MIFGARHRCRNTVRAPGTIHRLNILRDIRTDGRGRFEACWSRPVNPQDFDCNSLGGREYQTTISNTN